MRTVFNAWRELDLPRQKAEFYRMWQVGHSAGLGLCSVLESMGDFGRSPTVGRLRRILLEGVRQRRSITDTLRGHRDIVLPLELALLELGEDSGSLEQTLGMLADHFESEYRAVLDLKKKLAYPVAGAVAATFIAPFPILFFGNPFLYLSIVVIELSVILFLGGVLLGSVAAHHRSQSSAVVARLCRSLALGVEAGLSVDRVAELAVLAADDRALHAYWQQLPREKRRGGSLATMFSFAPHIPHNIIAALEVADVTGNYGETVRKLADLYDGGFVAGVIGRRNV